MCEEMKTHGHEEADTLILLYVLIKSIKDSTVKLIDVSSPDSDVLVDLINLAANHHLEKFTQLRMKTGKGDKYRIVDVRERMTALVKQNPKVSLELTTFLYLTGVVNGLVYLKRDGLQLIHLLTMMTAWYQPFNHLGNQKLYSKKVLICHLHICSPLRSFFGEDYSGNKSICTLPELRWQLFSTKNLEGKKLPPSRGALVPHVQRTNLLAMRDKS